MENKIKCPLTDEIIAILSVKGIRRMSNYREIWFILSDKSKLKQNISKNALGNLNEEQLDEALKKVKKDWIESTKQKPIDQKKKIKRIQKLKKIDYSQVVDKNGVLFEKVCQ